MEDKLYLLVLKFLNFRPRSEKEVREYIKKKQKKYPDITTSVIDLIIHKLKQQKFLNDQDFARWLVHSRTDFKPKGKRLVQMELRLKGISEDIINETLSSGDVRTQTDKDLAIDVLVRKKARFEPMEPQERFRKAGSFLARKGFDLDTIKAAIDSVFGKMV